MVATRIFRHIPTDHPEFEMTAEKWTYLIIITIEIQNVISSAGNLVKVNNEDTRGTSVFVNVSMCMLYYWIQQYFNLFQHLFFHSLFHLGHGEVHDEVNMSTS